MQGHPVPIRPALGHRIVPIAASLPGNGERGLKPTDYGRGRGVAWYYMGGFGLVHTQASQARVVKWGST